MHASQEQFFLLFWLVGHDFYSELLKLMSKWPGSFSVMRGFIYAVNFNIESIIDGATSC